MEGLAIVGVGEGRMTDRVFATVGSCRNNAQRAVSISERKSTHILIDCSSLPLVQTALLNPFHFIFHRRTHLELRQRLLE